MIKDSPVAGMIRVMPWSSVGPPVANSDKPFTWTAMTLIQTPRRGLPSSARVVRTSMT